MRNIDRISVKYKKLNITESQKAKHYIQLLKLKSLAPYGSWMHVDFEPKDGSIYGNIRINSASRKFTCSIQATELNDCLKKMIQDIDQQILLWKQTRFSNGGSNTASAQPTPA